MGRVLPAPPIARWQPQGALKCTLFTIPEQEQVAATPRLEGMLCDLSVQSAFVISQGVSKKVAIKESSARLFEMG